MNAHINLDWVLPRRKPSAEELQDLKGDSKNQQSIGDLVGGVQSNWRRYGLSWMVKPLSGQRTNCAHQFQHGKARDAAWSFAEKLSPLSKEQRQQEIVEKMKWLHCSRCDLPSGFYGSVIIGIIRLGERGTTRQRIEIWSNWFLVFSVLDQVHIEEDQFDWRTEQGFSQILEQLYHNESRRVLATLIRLLGDFDQARKRCMII